MPISASCVFDFLALHETCVIERHEVSDPAFATIRRSLRRIVFEFRESDDQQAREISDRLRTLLSEWLTVPIPFDAAIPDSLSAVLGDPDGVQLRWGRDMRHIYEAALRAAGDLVSAESPVRKELQEVVRTLCSQGRVFKVYCHRRARPHFESLLAPCGEVAIPEMVFLHSVRDYRESEPFDVLIKAGPLRSRGWGSAPDALITAPRFGKLLQVVWEGCNNEPEFGYNPLALPMVSAAPTRPSINWTTCVRESDHTGSRGDIDPSEPDELQAFADMAKPDDARAATLVILDGESAVLYPPHSPVISFDPNPNAAEQIRRRVPGDTLVEGMYLVRPLIFDVDLGGVRAEHGHHSRIWKDRLEQEWRSDALGLIQRLRRAGLNLVHLDAAIRHWCRRPSTVIHAPQQIRHFEILIDVLGLANERQILRGRSELAWWELAWIEVRRSRGEAIQAGVQEKEIVDDQLLDILRRLETPIRERALAGTDFNLPIPDRSEINGEFLFHRVLGIEQGFRAPDSELRVVRDLSTFDQWRS